MSDYDVVYNETKHTFLLPKTSIRHEVLPNGVYSIKVEKQMMGINVSLEKQDAEEITLPSYMLSSAENYCDDVYETWKSRGKNTGALFYGPPGTGKTVNTRYITRKACSEVPVIIIGIDCPVNIGLQVVKQYAPRAVVIIDELEKRFDKGFNNKESLELLDFLDGVFQYDYLTLMTSNSEDLPPTITKRPGRVRFVKYCGPLNADEVTELLKHYEVADRHRSQIAAISGTFCSNGIDLIITALSELAKQPDAETFSIITSLGCKVPWYIDAKDPTVNSAEDFKLVYMMEVHWRELNLSPMFPYISGEKADRVVGQSDTDDRRRVLIVGNGDGRAKLRDQFPEDIGENDEDDEEVRTMIPDDLYIYLSKDHLLEYNSKENYILVEGEIDFQSPHGRESVKIKVFLNPIQLPTELFRRTCKNNEDIGSIVKSRYGRMMRIAG